MKSMAGCPYRVLLLGGNANNGTNAGLVYSNSNWRASDTNANVGSRNYFSIRIDSIYMKYRGQRPCLSAKDI